MTDDTDKDQELSETPSLPVLPEEQPVLNVVLNSDSTQHGSLQIETDNKDVSNEKESLHKQEDSKRFHRAPLSMDFGGEIDFDALDMSTTLHSRASSGILCDRALMEEIPAAKHNNNVPDRIQLGICAMDKKARSKPMAEILSRLDEKQFEVIFFGDQVILNEPIEKWPQCDVLVAFFSKGYPLKKAMAYVELRKPLILNDLEMQELLQDRRRVYDLLEASGIDVPRHVYLSRDGFVSTGSGDGNGKRDPEVMEFDDHIEVNGVTIHKPFVEKPVNAEGECEAQ